VHVSMQGQEALFSENMSLKEVTKLLQQQQSATTPTQENARTQWQTTPDILLATGQENTENNHNNFWNATEVRVGESCTGNEMNSLIIQKMQYPEHEKAGGHFQFPLGAKSANQGKSNHPIEFLNASTSEDVPMEEEPVIFSKTNISEDRLDGYYTSTSATQVNSADIIPRNRKNSRLFIQRVYHPGPEMRDVSYEVPQDSTRASQGTSTCQEESFRESFSEEDPREVPEFLSRTEQPPSGPLNLCRNHEANTTYESHQRIHRDPKPDKCDECPRTFKYACNLSLHRKTHQNKRAFVSPTCQKKFKRVSDLQIHEISNKPEKSFTCSTCKRSFSPKTNMKVHERIHTGEKPYSCTQCNSTFRQSSSYYRHLRKYHKSE
ncbi:zinc finger and SCAN domain containing protein 4C-like, partial [Grammomys surdaster]|uniref:zinc finger and SCAN domain containing protein 4C-like n=1 Tax=Grammomys surdaster TaxID=491861 RepID=UPI0010A075AD